MTSVDVVVLGGGPAGYVAALRAAQLGGKVALVESAAVGGTCLNVGCIPTKTFLHSARLYDEIRAAKAFGIEVDGARLNFSTVRGRKDQIVRRLTGGVSGLLKQAGVTVTRGRGWLAAPDRVVVQGAGSGAGSGAGNGGGASAEHLEIQAKAIIVATGSVPADLPMARFNGSTIVSSTEALAFETVPARLMIVGGGVIGCEFASIYSSFGSEVTIVEAEPQLLPREDAELAETLVRELKRRGVKLLLPARLQSVAESPDGGISAVVLTKVGATESLASDRVLVAVGRRPCTAELGLEEIGVKIERGAIVVDERLETSVRGVFAAGDVTGGYQLAHVAFHEGAAAAENALGQGVPLRLRAVPRCVYTVPEIGAVGLTETEAKERYGEIKVGRFQFAANGKAMAQGETAGFVKVVAEAKYDQVVGVAIVGPGATELVGEAALAVAGECTLAELVDGVHAHPTLTEAIREAALAAAGRPLHGGH